jgi:hypothetical protein
MLSVVERARSDVWDLRFAFWSGTDFTELITAACEVGKQETDGLESFWTETWVAVRFFCCDFCWLRRRQVLTPESKWLGRASMACEWQSRLMVSRAAGAEAGR